MTLAEGDRLGRYQILGALGAGGMGEVYRACDTTLDRQVAVKVLPAAMAQDSDRLRRFELEAKAVARLAHPNILEIWDFGSDNGVSFAVTELLEGETLRDRLSRGPLEWRRAAEVGAAIADGLAAAHHQGIVHRDLKPSNLFLTSDARVKILDFGLAAVRAEVAAEQRVNGPGSTLTEDGTLIGTVGYMAPEQVRGEPFDHRADIFALGCVLYETVTGRRAFGRETAAETMTAILKDRPAEMSGTGVFPPPGLERSIRRCLEKRLDDRFQSAADLAHALREMSMISTPRFARLRYQPQRWIRRAVGLGIVVASVAAAAIVLSNLLFTTDDQPLLVRRYSINLPEESPILPSGELYPEPPLAVSPDAKWLVYVAGRRRGMQLMRRRLDGIEVETIEGAGQGVTAPFFSPDGRWVGFRRWGSGPLRVPLTGGAAQVLREPTEFQPIMGASWRDDGFIVFGGGHPPGIHCIPEDGGPSEPLLVADRAGGERGFLFPDSLPGDEGMLLLVLQHHLPFTYLAAQRLPSGDRSMAVSDTTLGRYASSGHIIYTAGGYPSDGRLMALPFDAKTLKVTGVPADVTEPGMGTGGRLPYEWSFSRHGTLVYAPMRPENVPRSTTMTCDANGAEEPIPMSPRLRADWLRMSPDGRRFVYGAQNLFAHLKTVRVHNLDNNGDSRVTFDADFEGFPIWTPDGKRIVYTSNRDGKDDLYWKPVDSDVSAQRLTDMDPRLKPVAYSFSPDGDTLFFWDWAPFEIGCDLWTVSLNEDPPRVEQLQSADRCLWCPAVSPDGRWLVYLFGGFPVITPYPAMNWSQMVTDQVCDSPVWHPDGSSIFCLDVSGNIVEIEIQTNPTISLMPARVVVEGNFESLDITPDGRRFLVIKTELGEPITELIVVENWFEELKRKAPPRR